jgi:hypothetical protein
MRNEQPSQTLKVSPAIAAGFTTRFFGRYRDLVAMKASDPA